MRHRTTLVAAVAAIGSLVVSVPAHAEDRRSCVSTTEYHDTKDVARFRTADKVTPPTRRELEDRWEVRGLGVIDPEYSDAKSTMWMYEVCGYSFDEAQVWVMTTGRSGVAQIMTLWKEAGAISNGHEYRAG